MRLYVGLHTRADTLLVGCLTGLLVTWNMLPKSRRFAIWITIAAMFAAVALGYISWKRCLDHSQFYHGLFTAVAVMVATIIVHMLITPAGIGARALQFGPLVGVGRISYGLYLFHVPIIHCFDDKEIGWEHPANTLLVAGLSFGVAVFSYFVVERPCLRLKDRFRSRGSPCIRSELP